MEAQANFNRRTARTIDVDAMAMRNRLDTTGRPIALWFRAGNSRSRLMVSMTEKEALKLAAELYAMSDDPKNHIKTTYPIDTDHKNTVP